MTTGVFPQMFHFLQKYDIYVMRFFKEQWRYVFIDSTLCCKKETAAEIVYSKCRNENELWVSLIEKAYAKLHHSYQQLESGDISQALADMTGLIADKILLPDKYSKLEKD